MSSQYDVAIVGSGPTGLALAALLAGQDVRVGLFDRGYDAVATPRATHIDDEVMRIFQALRVAYDLEPELYFTPGYEMFDSAWNCFYEIRVAEGVGEQGWRSDYMFHQPSFERRLREALDASDLVDLHQGVAVEALSQSDSGVEVQARDVEGGEARCFRAAFVVGCDGAHSTVRRVMESDVENLEGAQRWLVTDVLLHEGVDDVPERLFSYCAEPPELSVTYVTTGTRRRRVEFKMPAGADAEEFEQPDKVWALLGPYIGRDKGQLERADVYTFNSRLAVTWRSGRLFLAGDAAHEMPPKAGQGLCSGFRDAMNLAWKLAYVVKGQAAESLLESYQTERRPHALHWIQVSDFMARSIDAMSQGATPPPPPATEDEAAPGPPRPPLGPGLHGDLDHGGELSVQPRKADGTRMDDVVDYGFAVIATPEVLAAIDDASRGTWDRLSATVLSAAQAGWEGWLESTGVAAAIVRPDRYLLGTATTPQELAEMTTKLAAVLDGEPAAR